MKPRENFNLKEGIVLIVRQSLFIRGQLRGLEKQKRGSVTHDELFQLETNGSQFDITMWIQHRCFSSCTYASSNLSINL